MFQETYIAFGLRICLAVSGCAIAGTVHAHATFTPLGTFGALNSFAHDVSADGSVVVGVAGPFPDGTHGIFRWTRSENIVRKESARNLAVSDDGTTIVGGLFFLQTGLEKAFRWVPAEGLFEGFDFPGGAYRSAAHDVSADGSVIVGYGSNQQSDRAFRWTEAGGMVDLGAGIAHGVSSDGSVIVGRNQRAFRWTAQAGMVALPSLNESFSSAANGVSADGKVVVGTHNFRGTLELGLSEATRWTDQEGAVRLFPGSFARPWDVSADGSVIVGGTDAVTAFYWTPQIGMASLRDVLSFGGATGLEGWQLRTVTGISHDGQTVVGYATDSNGGSQAFVATIGAVPEPSTILLAVFAAAGLVGLTIRRVRSQ